MEMIPNPNSLDGKLNLERGSPRGRRRGGGKAIISHAWLCLLDVVYLGRLGSSIFRLHTSTPTRGAFVLMVASQILGAPF